MKINYRPEIDGLRAIAVVAVILYHAQIIIFGHQPFKGGFIGVDIFLVISGYLITSIILKELVTTGSFSFKHFYERRIRRILPALLAVMLISLPFAWMFLISNSFIDFSKSILSSLGFSSNFYFWYSGQQYGAESGLLKPFLHTWSLSVEEQYYFLFPIILLVTYKFFRKYLIHILLFGFVISLVLADWGSRNYTSATFYFLHTRMWELIAGSILAYFEITLGHRSKYQTLNLILPALGLFLIGHSILFFNDKMFHPSFYTLSPIIGVCLIIWFSNKDEFITKILSTKLFVGIGLISYSLYLWHYPIFAFARITNFFQGDIFKKIFFGLIILILSIVSYYFIEKPARNKKYEFKNISKLLIIIVLVISTINGLVIYKNGRVGYYWQLSKEIYLNNNFFNNELQRDSWKYVNNFNFQEFKSKGKVKVLIVGDSHSKDLFNALIQNKILFKSYEFLRYGDNVNNNPLNFGNITKEELIQFSSSKIFKQSDLILISNYFQKDESIDKLDIFLDMFKNRKQIILTSNSNIYTSPEKRFGSNLTLFDNFLLDNNKNKKFIDKNLTFNDMYKINSYYYNNRKIKKIKSINNQLKAIAKKHNIQILFKEDIQCDINKKICFGVTDKGMKSHYDSAHFTLEGAKFFGKRIYEINWLKVD
jgi:peptidoglycan/LPS O-acetylase OafA/YrhL